LSWFVDILDPWNLDSKQVVALLEAGSVLWFVVGTWDRCYRGNISTVLWEVVSVLSVEDIFGQLNPKYIQAGTLGQ
jgi:hypothetical protein